MLSTVSTINTAHPPTQNIEHEERHVEAEGAPAQRLKTGGWDMVHSFQSSIPHTSTARTTFVRGAYIVRSHAAVPTWLNECYQ